MIISELTLIDSLSTIHPDHLVSDSVEFFGKSKFRVEIEATRKNNRTGTLTMFQSDDGEIWEQCASVNIDDTNFKSKVKFANFTKDFFKVEYQSISGNGGYLTVKLVS
jgi:hypothetical protein